MTEDLTWELVVIGGGPAGMTAAIYGSRYGLKTILIESKVLGGAQATSPGIENYPGYTFISGIELAEKMKEQVRKSGAAIKEITEVKSIEIADGGTFHLDTRRGVYQAKAVVLATGGGHRKLNLPGEDLYTGRGVSYCATCDGPLFRNKTLAVVGGGNTAVTEALYLSELTDTLFLIHRRDRLRAEHIIQQMIFDTHVEILWDTVVKEFRGDEQLLREIELENVKTGEKKTLEVDGTFVALGSDPESKLAKPLGVDMNKRGEIYADGEQKTNIPGLFAAGDVVQSLKQIVVAAGQGAIAADSAYKYIREVKRGPL
ncbi:MAG: NAD(P)/FAD-dependent oxidoreductase [Candidatus Thorarchaeota archaeon]|jgi:thioredoxin reductase (NADPH)